MRRVSVTNPARPCEQTNGVTLLLLQKKNGMEVCELPIIQDVVFAILVVEPSTI